MAEQQNPPEVFIHISLDVLGNTVTDEMEIFLVCEPYRMVWGTEVGKGGGQEKKWESKMYCIGTTIHHPAVLHRGRELKKYVC